LHLPILVNRSAMTSGNQLHPLNLTLTDSA
jgi:hypothetical protein